MIRIIVALDLYDGIGKDNKLPWSVPEDLKFFKENTIDKVVIMGRKTYESIGRPLKDRTNVVISRNTNLDIPGVIVFNSIDEALKKYEDQDVYIIGGAEIYEQSLDYVDELIITLISGGYDCDTYFPAYADKFKLTSASDHYRSTLSNIGYRFTKWERK